MFHFHFKIGYVANSIINLANIGRYSIYFKNEDNRFYRIYRAIEVMKGWVWIKNLGEGENLSYIFIKETSKRNKSIFEVFPTDQRFREYKSLV